MNPILKQLYAEMKKLLSNGDDEFVTKGPDLLKSFYENPGFLEGYAWKNPDQFYTRTRLVGNGENSLVFRLMEWPADFTLPPHSHHGRPCIEIVLKGEMVFTHYFLENKTATLETVTMHEGAPFRSFPGDTMTIDPRFTEIHKVQTIGATASLNVYPLDARTTTLFDHVTSDAYKPRIVQLRND